MRVFLLLFAMMVFGGQTVVTRPLTFSTPRSPASIIVCDEVDLTGTLTNVEEVCRVSGIR